MIIQAAGSTIGHGTLAGLSGGYRWRGDPEWPWPPGDVRWQLSEPEPEPEPEPDPGPTPREIVDELHREIAAMSPEHAALVASYEAGRVTTVPRGSGALQTQRDARLARLRDYAALRAAGKGRAEAAAAVGIALRTATDYDADIRHGLTPGTLEAA